MALADSVRDKRDTTQQLSPVIEPIQHDPRGGLKFRCVQHQQLDSIFLSFSPFLLSSLSLFAPFCCSSIHPSYVHIEFNRALFWNSLRAIKDQGFRNMFKRLFNRISCPCISLTFDPLSKRILIFADASPSQEAAERRGWVCGLL